MIPAAAPRRSSVQTENVPVPQGYINYRASDRLAVGIGALAPYGLGLEWPVCEAESTPNCGHHQLRGPLHGLRQHV